MNGKHLAAGQSCPALIPESLRIYGMRFCPYVHRALLVAVAKGIQFDVVNIDLVSKPDYLFAKNPEGKVPIIETSDGRILYESLIVCDYMDEIFNNSSARRLNPSDHYQKALDRIWVEKFTKIGTLDFQLYFPTDLPSDQAVLLITKLDEELKLLEKELERRGTQFFAGSEKPGMLDYMIWPWIERLPSIELLQKTHVTNLRECRQRHRLLSQWEKAMMNDNAVRECYLPPQAYEKYRNMKRNGGPINFDCL